MKVFVAFLACLAVASAVPAGIRRAGNKDLADSLEELLQLLDVGGFFDLLAAQEAEGNPDFLRLLETLRSDDFVAMVTDVMATPEWIDFVQYNLDNNVDIIETLRPLLDIIGNWPKAGQKAVSTRTYDELIATWSAHFEPMAADALEWLIIALQTDPAIQDLLAYLQSDSFVSLVQYIRTQDATQALAADLEAEGVDVSGALQTVADFLEWDIPPY